MDILKAGGPKVRSGSIKNVYVDFLQAGREHQQNGKKEKTTLQAGLVRRVGPGRQTAAPGGGWGPDTGTSPPMPQAPGSLLYKDTA